MAHLCEVQGPQYLIVSDVDDQRSASRHSQGVSPARVVVVYIGKTDGELHDIQRRVQTVQAASDLPKVVGFEPLVR